MQDLQMACLYYFHMKSTACDVGERELVLRQNITSDLRGQRLGRSPWCSTSERSTLRTDVSIEVLERSGEGEEREKVRRGRGREEEA